MNWSFSITTEIDLARQIIDDLFDLDGTRAFQVPRPAGMPQRLTKLWM
jgi:hypothetical protein